MNRSIIVGRLNQYSKSSEQRKSQHQMVSLVNSTRHLNKNQYQSFSNSSQKLQKRENFQTRFTRHYPETKTRQGQHKKRKLQASIPNEQRCRNPQQNISQLNLAISYTIVNRDLFQGCKDGSTSAN